MRSTGGGTDWQASLETGKNTAPIVGESSEMQGWRKRKRYCVVLTEAHQGLQEGDVIHDNTDNILYSPLQSDKTPSCALSVCVNRRVESFHMAGK